MRSDKWFEKEVLPQLTGFARLIRYADDFVVCFEKEVEARVFGDELRRQMGKFGLTISEEKSKILEFGRCACTGAKQYGWKCETFDFLGFTHFCDKSGWGNFKLGWKTSPEEVQTEDDGNDVWLKRIRNHVKLKEWWRVLGLTLLGHYRYYESKRQLPYAKELLPSGRETCL